jgi:calcineurin-like phosphoesterase family protein
MSETWFTADLHFDHANILSYTRRPWPNIEAMNDALVCNWNHLVAPEDTVLILGDLAMGKRSDSVPIAKLLNGQKVLIPGNHDSCWEHGRDGKKPTDVFSRAEHTRNQVAKYMEWGGLTSVWQPPITGFTAGGHRVILSHLPPLECGDHKAGEAVYDNEVRFVDKRPAYPQEETWMLCGHVHEAWKVHGRVINVGVDVWDYAPVSSRQIIDIIEGRAIGVLC